MSGGLTEDMIECFVVYLCAHNRPFHETLFSPTKNHERLYETAFVGMTDQPCSWCDLASVRDQLQDMVLHRLGQRRIDFIKSFAEANPRWDLCRFSDAKELPAIQWKLQNLIHLKDSNHEKFNAQKEALFSRLAPFTKKTQGRRLCEKH